MTDWISRLQALLAPHPWVSSALTLAGLLLAAWLADWLTRRILLRAVRKLVLASPTEWDNAFMARGVLTRFAGVVPALVVFFGIGMVSDLPDRLVEVVRSLAQAFVVLTVALSLRNLVNALGDLYARNEARAHARPIKGYLQVVKLAVFVLAGLSIFATLVGAKFLHVLTGLGAMTAVVMLIFQDTILSFVASVQIGSDGRVRVGDWIEMPGQNADGTVTDIALHTVTVQNWDKTITTIPTKKLISDSFKNWRGMSEAGGRRIKRALYLDQKSVRFLEDGEEARLRRLRPIGGYIDGKQRELAEWNAGLGVDEAVNARRLTNVGTFRAYAEHYLRQHPAVRQDMTLLVRQLQPGQHGLPIEVYCFSADTRWAAYEGLQSDIFDHLLAILPQFGLRVFQASSDAPLQVALVDGRGDAGQPPATAGN